MNKILKFFQRRITCMNNRTDSEIANENRFSPMVTRSKAKKQQRTESTVKGCKQKKIDDESQRKPRNGGKTKGKKTNTSAGELNSVRASRGSVGSVSLLQTSKTCEGVPGTGPVDTSVRGDSKCGEGGVDSELSKGKLSAAISPKDSIRTNNNIPTAKSPPLGTLSADTPSRNVQFQKELENIAECRLRILGKGSFGTIIQATYKGELVAAKIVPPNKSSTLKNELNNFLLSHPNIVKTLRIIANDENNSCGLVIMEMCSAYTLDHFASEETYSLDEKLITKFMIDISKALEYCHSQKVLHLDVKPQNILVNVSSNICKLCDFGSSCLLTGDEMFVEGDRKTLVRKKRARFFYKKRRKSWKMKLYPKQSTVVYTSPEMLTGGPPTEKCDVYSFGIMLWQLVFREKPYAVDNKVDLQSTIYKIVKQRKRPEKKIRKDDNLEKLYISCWDHDPDRRPYMKEIVQYLESLQTQ